MMSGYGQGHGYDCIFVIQDADKDVAMYLLILDSIVYIKKSIKFLLLNTANFIFTFISNKLDAKNKRTNRMYIK